MAEAAFSEDGNYYSAISQDGRLRIWDTETNVLKQEYTPDLHLTSPPSCLQWITVTQVPGTQKNANKRSSASEQETQCIALGTSSGKILIYSVTQAKVETVLIDKKNNEIHAKKVSALDWRRQFGLFSFSDDVVREWDLQSGSIRNKYNVHVASTNKQANSISAIKIVPHSLKTTVRFLLVASWQVRLWRLHNSDATVVKCLGHNAAPRALLTLTTVKDTCWLIEGSQTERLLSCWDVTITADLLPHQNGEEVTPNKRQRRKSASIPTVPTPTYNFVLEDAPRLIDVDVKDEGTKMCIAAVTRSGVVHYYGHMLNGSSTKPIKPSVTIQVTTGDAKPLPLQCCRLPASGDIVLGYSSGPVLMFEKIIPDIKTKTQVLIRGDVKAVKKKGKNDAAKVRSEATGDVAYLEPLGGVSRKRDAPGGNVEVSMEARLANLTVDVRGGGGRGAAVSQNLTKLLMQALHSKDRSLILTVLQKDDPAVADRTVSALPADYVPMLLEQLADMATKKTSQCGSVCTWATACVSRHSALLLASLRAPAAAHLTHLLAVFTHRRSNLCQLLNLKGRVELTMVQRRHTNTVAEQEPVLQYKDTSSDEEMEVERYQSESEHSWGADGGESDDGGSHSSMSDD